MNKMVLFDQYCKSCKDKDTKESKDPCNECLSQARLPLPAEIAELFKTA